MNNLFIRFCTISIIIGVINSIESSTEENTTQNISQTEDETKIIADTDVIQLNVGGRLITTTRSTLTCIPISTLAIMFNGRWENELNRDKYGNIFLDFNPILFHHLLEQLRLIDNHYSIQFHPPLSPSLVLPFEKMLRKLGINQSQTFNDVIELNVGGEVLITRQKIFTQVSNYTTNLFVDSNPKIFRQLINQLREEEIEIESFNTTLTQITIIPDYNDGICANATWNPHGITVSGGHGQGSTLHQLDHPMGLFVDESSSIYIADTHNHRIIKWLPGGSYGHIIVDYNNSKNYVSSVVVDQNGTVYFCDRINNHIEQWLKNVNHGEIILTNISCWGLKLDKQGSLYISIQEDHRVIKWPNNEIVAGGNGEGPGLNQLSSPYQLFIDDKQSIYIADYFNHRIMKWFNDSQEGIIVAGGDGYGSELNQLKLPHAVIVDQMETMYIVDFGNDRILRWFKDSKLGDIIIGNDGSGKGSSQLSDPYDLAFDKEGNLYVADTSNHRVQMFRIDKSLCTSTSDSNER